MCKDASVGMTLNTHHIVHQLGDALNEEPHPFPKSLWVDGTLQPINSGATGGLPRINLQKNQPYLQEDLNARSEETMEPAALHRGSPDAPERPVLDVPGVAKELGFLCIPIVIVVVVIIVIGVLVGVIDRGNEDVTHLL